MRDKRGNGERDWGNIDWSNLDLSSIGMRRGNAPRPPSRRSIVITVLAALLLLVPLLLIPLNEFLTDLLWFRSLGLEDVYLRRYTAGFWAFVAFFLIFFALAIPNLYLALRPQVPRVVVDTERPRPSALAQTLRLLWVITIPAFFFGLAGGDQWDQLLRFVNAVPFGVTDPLFGRDIGFYFFTLPVLDFLRGWSIAAVLVIAAGVVFLYAVRGVISVATSQIARGNLDVAGRTALALARPARAHLSVLGGIFLLLVAGGYILDQFDLLFRTERVLTGAGFASVNARIPALTILAVIVGIAAVACFANAFARTVWVLGGALVVWFAATVLVGGVYPALVQNFIVTPDELNKERPYLERSIAGTRSAYALDKVEESLFNVSETPSQAEARAEFSDTLSVRLWDYNRLLSAFDQLQALRQYYDFVDVDVDRYRIGNRELPVMLSARELNTASLPQSWVNRHLQFTHGFGAVITPVGGVTPEGQPQLMVKDIPPQGEPKIDQPRIYYGELTNDYVIVDTGMEEFDFPQEVADARTRYSGGGGVGVSSLWDRLLFTVRFGETNLLVSDQIRSQSRLLFHRNITERQQLIAPFLEYDHDPYLVVADGQLWWINDAYTVGDRYPYSERFETLVRGGTQVADGEPQLHPEQRQGRHERVRRIRRLLRDRRDRSRRAHAPCDLPEPVQVARRHAADPQGPPALSRGSLLDPGAGVRDLPHDRHRQLLQPRRRVADREQGAGAGSGQGADRAVLRHDEAAGFGSQGVHPLRSDDAGRRCARQHGRVDRGPRRRARLRQAARAPLPAGPADLRPAADRRDHRQRRDDQAAAHAALSAGRRIDVLPRQSARASRSEIRSSTSKGSSSRRRRAASRSCSA